MAAAEIAPVVSVDMLESGSAVMRPVLGLEEEQAMPYVIQDVPALLKEHQRSEISVKFTESAAVVTVIAISSAPARPSSILFGAIADPKLRLRRPIPLTVSFEEGHVVLLWEETDEFSCGVSMGEALDDFAKSIADLFVELNDKDMVLGPDLERVRDVLNRHIAVRS